MTATKFKGKDLSLLIDAEEVNADGTSIVLDHEDAEEDALTFAEYSATGGETPQQWFFQITAISDYGATSFWTALWDNAGDELAFIFKPYGNAVASATQPHFTGTAKVIAKPPIGGEAGSVWTYEARLDLPAGTEPTRVIAP